MSMMSAPCARNSMPRSTADSTLVRMLF